VDAETFSSSCTATATDWLDNLDLLLGQTRQATGKPWVGIQQLSVAYQARYATSLAAIADRSHCSLKELLAESDRFALYNTPVAGHFYVARRTDLDAGYRPSSLPRSAPRQTCSPRPQPYRAQLPPRLASEQDLAIALLELFRQLAQQQPQPAVGLGAIAKLFYQHYREPLRAALHRLAIRLSLAEFLAQQDALQLRRIGRELQVAWREQA